LGEREREERGAGRQAWGQARMKGESREGQRRAKRRAARTEGDLSAGSAGKEDVGHFSVQTFYGGLEADARKHDPVHDSVHEEDEREGDDSPRDEGDEAV
jgi:hypothetical protein